MTIIFYIILLLTGCLAAGATFFLHGATLWTALGILAVIAVLLIVVYRKTIMPLAALKHGIDLLLSQDFGSRLAKVGSPEADNIGAVFNRMMDTLKNERLRVLEQNQFLDMLVEASPMGVVIYDYNRNIKSQNKAARTFLQSDELHARFDELKIGDTVTVRLSDTHIYRLSSLYFMDRGFKRPFSLIESLSEEVRRVEKAAYDKVIRQMSHEVNNTVAGLSFTLETLESSLDDPDLAEAVAAGHERLLSLSRFITSYADMVKLPAPDMHDVDMTSLLAAMSPFLESLAAGQAIHINISTPDEPLMLRADPVQMEQVVVNIVKNSIESIRDGGAPGNVEISLDPRGIIVTDDGPGINPDAALNIFTPFFSTKLGGHGIGLMFVSEILRNHGYSFSLRTDPDRRTRFRIHF